MRIPVSGNHGILARYANRHGLITGATGTGKTVSLQRLAQSFSEAGVPVFITDIKGDIAGLATGKSPVSFYDVFGTNGAKLSLTLDSLGVDLLARLLGLTDAQKGILEFAFMQNPGMKTLNDLTLSIYAELEQGATAASLAVLQRAMIRFDRQAGELIGESCFDIAKLFEGNTISILDCQRLQLSPVAYSTLMLWLLSELFERLPEAGDLDKPLLVLFIDESHLLFNDATPELLQTIERTIRLIRSKGVGVYFVSQIPDDIPGPVLSQLGNRIQHRLSGATPRDIRAIKIAAESMPINPAINAGELIGKLETGQALVSFIGESGAPRPCELVRVSLPDCRLGAISEAERALHIPAMPEAMPQGYKLKAATVCKELAFMAFVIGGLWYSFF